MYQTIVVPLDGSPLAEQALATATGLAERANARLELLRAHELMIRDLGDQVPLEQAMREEAEEYLYRTAKGIQDESGLHAGTKVVEGPASQTICNYARTLSQPLIVMSTHGRTGFNRLWMGSVADAVVRDGCAPVLLLRPAESPDGVLEPIPPFKRMLVPLDGSGYAEQVVPKAMALAELTGAQVLLLEVVRPVFTPAFVPAMEFAVAYTPPEEFAEAATESEVEQAAAYMSGLAAKLRREYATLDIQTDVLTDQSPARAILDSAASHGTDVVALATHGRGASRFFVGSVADKVLRGGPRAMLVVRPR